MVEKGKTLGCYAFGRALVETGDLDPVYVLVWNAPSLRHGLLRRWLLAYWCFYHVGTACKIADPSDGRAFWEKMAEAAGTKDYPRSAERRHFRGGQALRSVEYLKSRGVDELFKDLLGAGRGAAEKMRAARGWLGFGEWVSFKIADMLERLAFCPVEFDLETAMYSEPRKGAELLWRAENGERPLPEEGAGAWACARILEELSGLTAPPRHERPLNLQEAETVLCKWKSHTRGRYHVGEDVAACKKALGWAGGSDRLLSQEMDEAGRRGGLWR